MIGSRKLFVVASLLALGLGLSACNTVDGAGRDIEHAGEVVQDAAQ